MSNNHIPAKALRRVNKYLQLFRTGNALMGIVGVVVACFTVAGTVVVVDWANVVL